MSCLWTHIYNLLKTTAADTESGQLVAFVFNLMVVHVVGGQANSYCII